jgi:hypothetical protein
MAVPAVTVDIVEKVDAFLTGWRPTRTPEGPKKEHGVGKGKEEETLPTPCSG